MVKIRIGDFVAGGRIRDRAVVVQQKTKRPVQFKMVEPARKTLFSWLERRGGTLNDFVFPSRNDYMGHISTRQYARLVCEWVPLQHDVRLTRTGHSMRLVHDSGMASDTRPNAALIRLLVQARGWWAELRKGELDVTALARREGTTSSYVSRVLRLAFLAPDLVQTILDGRQAIAVTVHALKREAIIVLDWRAQRTAFVAGGPG